MGRPKHGVNSARTRACKKYKETGRLLINKAEKKKKLESGKKIKSRRTPKTSLMRWNELIRKTKKVVPYCDPVSGMVYWGTDKEDSKSIGKRVKRAS